MRATVPIVFSAIVGGVPGPPDQRLHGPDRCQSVERFLGVLLHDAAVRRHDAEHCSTGAVRRTAEQRGADRGRLQRSGITWVGTRPVRSSK